MLYQIETISITNMKRLFAFSGELTLAQTVQEQCPVGMLVPNIEGR